MNVIGGDELCAIALTKFDQFAVDLGQFWDVMVLKFEEEPIATEDFKIPIQQFRRPGILAALDRPRHLARKTPGGADQAFVVRCQEFMVDTRPVIEAFKLTGCGNGKQVPVAGFVLGQEKQVIRTAVHGWIPILHPACGEVTFHPDNWFYIRGLRRPVKVDDPEHGAMIGDRQGWHIQRLGLAYKFIDLAQAIEK